MQLIDAVVTGKNGEFSLMRRDNLVSLRPRATRGWVGDWKVEDVTATPLAREIENIVDGTPGDDARKPSTSTIGLVAAMLND